MYPEKSINDFLAELSSKNSIPGGGSAAALTGAVTASVVSFIANLTVGKKKYQDVEGEAKEILAESTKLMDELAEMIDKDSEVLDEILATYKTGDKEALLSVSKSAVDFSMDMTKKCVEIMELALHISRIGNRMLASDFEVAAHLGDAAVNSAIANVKINLGNLKDEKHITEVKNSYTILQKKSQQLKKDILANA